MLDTDKFDEVFADTEPTKPVEIIRPTRVTWTHKNKVRTSRVFPTEARAWEFAVDKKDAIVTDAKEPVPDHESPHHVNRFRLHVRQFADAADRKVD